MKPDAAHKGCGLSKSTAEHLAKIGYDQVVCPFGILVVGHKDISANNVKFAANVIAELLDLDRYSKADGAEAGPLLAKAT